MKKVLAIDMGATSIRGILGYIENGELKMDEVMRFSHDIVPENGRLCWQWDALLQKIAETVYTHKDEITSVGVDTWGVDFGLLDKEGNLICHPISYRDSKHEDGFQMAAENMELSELFVETGNQIMSINTLFQLLALKKYQPEVWKKADKLLMMPDLIQYYLCGAVGGEETIWSTTQMMNLKDKTVHPSLLERFGLSDKLIPEIQQCGAVRGNTANAKIEKLRACNVNVVSVCGHDTASAVLLTKAYQTSECMFISCGTWSLVGGLVESAVLTHAAYADDLTNELGYGGSAMFFKNITGLYFLEKLKKQLEQKRGSSISFEEITNHVSQNTEGYPYIDLEQEVFGREDVDASQAIETYLKQTNQKIPQNEMDYFGIIYGSMVAKYQQTRELIEKISGKKFTSIHMIGGGARSSYLCQCIADQMQLPVTAGPFEASAMGNILIQLESCGEIPSIQDGIELALKSQKAAVYMPK